MKPNQFIKKYKSDEVGTKFNHKWFVADLADDFKEKVDFYAQMKGEVTFKHFQLAVTETSQKFDAIVRKSLGDPDSWKKIWNYFFATVVVPERSKNFTEEQLPQRASKKTEHRKKPISLGERDQVLRFLQRSFERPGATKD